MAVQSPSLFSSSNFQLDSYRRVLTIDSYSEIQRIRHLWTSPTDQNDYQHRKDDYGDLSISTSITLILRLFIMCSFLTSLLSKYAAITYVALGG